jgi:hypothetical protein
MFMIAKDRKRRHNEKQKQSTKQIARRNRRYEHNNIRNDRRIQNTEIRPIVKRNKIMKQMKTMKKMMMMIILIRMQCQGRTSVLSHAYVVVLAINYALYCSLI